MSKFFIKKDKTSFRKIKFMEYKDQNTTYPLTINLNNTTLYSVVGNS